MSKSNYIKLISAASQDFISAIRQDKVGFCSVWHFAAITDIPAIPLPA
jgi:hypothetical protein